MSEAVLVEGKAEAKPEVVVKRKYGRNTPIAAPLWEETDPDAPEKLTLFRFVFNNTGGRDKTQAQRSLRQWLKRDPVGFMKELGRLEDEYAAEKKRKAEAAAPVSGELAPANEGVDELVGKLEEMLRSWREEREAKKRDAAGG